MKADVGFRLKELTDKRGVDSVIETSGSAAALQALIGSAMAGSFLMLPLLNLFQLGLILVAKHISIMQKSSLLEHLVNQTQITQDGTVNESRTHVGNY